MLEPHLRELLRDLPQAARGSRIERADRQFAVSLREGLVTHLPGLKARGSAQLDAD
jgi:hypothetical protein